MLHSQDFWTLKRCTRQEVKKSLSAKKSQEKKRSVACFVHKSLYACTGQRMKDLFLCCAAELFQAICIDHIVQFYLSIYFLGNSLWDNQSNTDFTLPSSDNFSGRLGLCRSHAWKPAFSLGGRPMRDQLRVIKGPVDMSMNDLFQGGFENRANLRGVSYLNSPLPHSHRASNRSEIFPCGTPLFQCVVPL